MKENKMTTNQSNQPNQTNHKYIPPEIYVTKYYNITRALATIKSITRINLNMLKAHQHLVILVDCTDYVNLTKKPLNIQYVTKLVREAMNHNAKLLYTMSIEYKTDPVHILHINFKPSSSLNINLETFKCDMCGRLLSSEYFEASNKVTKAPFTICDDCLKITEIKEF